MPSTWFTSDHHFGHENIIRHCSRPFVDANEMTEAMIARWNEIVQPEDVVWHLGDLFSFKSREMNRDQAWSIRVRLNGIIRLIMGNHDVQPWLADILTEPNIGIYREMKAEGRSLVLFHYPIESWDGKHHGAVHLHGHSHGQLRTVIENWFDVGVDAHDFRPVSLEQLLAKQVP